ncbi:MAG: hypothetical protein H6810_11745 [Phycisphaeraceae bacterium]|nr:MAG: hypothetical protein H6810_11745 [Phycisphaeraceae bacterium]
MPAESPDTSGSDGPRRRRRRALLLVGGIVVVALVGVGLRSWYVAWTTPKETAVDALAWTRIQAIAQALRLYADTHAGQFPTNADGWQDVLIAEFQVSPSIFTSPRSDAVGADCFYVPGYAATPDPARVLVYEDPSLDPDKTLIAYADGHVASVPQAEALRILAGLTLPDGSHWAPHLDPTERRP